MEPSILAQTAAGLLSGQPGPEPIPVVPSFLRHTIKMCDELQQVRSCVCS